METTHRATTRLEGSTAFATQAIGPQTTTRRSSPMTALSVQVPKGAASDGHLVTELQRMGRGWDHGGES